MTLTEFLLARIAEDEAVARAAQVTGDGWFQDGAEIWSHMQLVAHPWMQEHSDHIARHDPARVLAECEAKRRIVERLSPLVEYDRDRFIVMPNAERVARDALRILALPNADHPDCREEWKP